MPRASTLSTSAIEHCMVKLKVPKVGSWEHGRKSTNLEEGTELFGDLLSKIFPPKILRVPTRRIIVMLSTLDRRIQKHHKDIT